jgi:DNA-binding beta-propeller fold protein YncE
VSAVTCLINPIGEIAVNPTSGTVVATHPRDCTLSILDLDDPTDVTAIRVNGDPLAVTVTGGRAFVATTSASYDAISVIDLDTRTVLSVHPLAFNITGIAVSPDRAQLFAARTGRLGSDVAVLDLATAEVTSIPVAAPGTWSIDVIRTDTAGHLYISLCSFDDGELVVIDRGRREVVRSLRVGAPIRDMAVSPDGAVVYMLTHQPREAAAVICVDLLHRAMGVVTKVSESATQLVVSADGSDIYVMDREGVAVVCVCTGSVVERTTVAAVPSCIALNSALSLLYVADHACQMTSRPAVSPVLHAATG